LPSLYDDGRVNIQAQWALKRTCKHFWNLSELIAPSDFFNLHHNLAFPVVKKREEQRLIAAAFAPWSFPQACFLCYKCRNFLALSDLHPFWGEHFYVWNERYLLCFTPCLTELADDASGRAVEKMLYSDSRHRDKDEDVFLRVQDLMSVEVQQELIEADLKMHTATMRHR
jgi:hypothetical protein